MVGLVLQMSRLWQLVIDWFGEGHADRSKQSADTNHQEEGNSNQKRHILIPAGRGRVRLRSPERGPFRSVRSRIEPSHFAQIFEIDLKSDKDFERKHPGWSPNKRTANEVLFVCSLLIGRLFVLFAL